MDEGWALTGAAMLRSPLKGAQARFGIGTVHFLKVKIRKVGHKARDVAAGRIHFYRNADGVAVVFNHEDDGQLLVGGGVESLPELTLGGRPLSDASENNFVAV